MKNREKAIIMAYTGVCMLSGDEFQHFHKYVEEIMGRPVFTHELADKAICDKIKEKAKPDFLKLCAESNVSIGRGMNPVIEAVKTFGKESQMKMAIEEMSELTKELCKNFRGAGNTDAIAEEIADVEIMLEQMIYIFECTDKVVEWKEYKIRRLGQMLDERRQRNDLRRM